MRPDEQRPEQQPDQITDLPIRDATDATDVADKVKGGDGTTTTTSTILKQQHDTAAGTIANMR
jgi:hypothetical protein